jgi:hypothetical protein
MIADDHAVCASYNRVGVCGKAQKGSCLTRGHVFVKANDSDD